MLIYRPEQFVMKTAVWVVAAMLALSSCEKNPGGSDTEKELVPLAVGNYWAYQQLWYGGVDGEVLEGLTDSVLFMVIGDTLLSIDGSEHRTAIRSSTFPFDGVPADHRWLYWNGDDGTYLMGGISGNDTLIYKSMVYKFPISKGESWQAHRIYYDYFLQEFEVPLATWELLSLLRYLFLPFLQFS